ncbi:Hypothetical predicted protein, partial [Pelobates cultripes]
MRQGRLRLGTGRGAREVAAAAGDGNTHNPPTPSPTPPSHTHEHTSKDRHSSKTKPKDLNKTPPHDETDWWQYQNEATLHSVTRNSTLNRPIDSQDTEWGNTADSTEGKTHMGDTEPK